jgi:hypothetical protein
MHHMEWARVYDADDSESYALLVETGAIYRHRIIRGSGKPAEAIAFVPGVEALEGIEWTRVLDGQNSETYRAAVHGGALYRHMIWTQTDFIIQMVFVPVETKKKASRAKAKKAPAKKSKAAKPKKKKASKPKKKKAATNKK